MRRPKKRLGIWRKRADAPYVLERTVRFDSFVLCPESGELYKKAKPIAIQPQPFKVLTLLTHSPGRVVARATIQKELWDDDTFVDFDLGINHCIKQIRNALGDDAKAPRYIETVPRRGYRFVAEVVFEPAMTSARSNLHQWWRAVQTRVTLSWNREEQA